MGFTVATASLTGVVATVIVWGTEKIPDKRQYIIPLAIQAAAPGSFFLLSLVLSESPMWLLSKGRVDEARKVLASLRTNDIALVETEIFIAQTAQVQQMSGPANVKWWEILRKSQLERTLVSGAGLCLGEASGQILTATYSTVLLVQSGVSDPFRITVILFVINFLGTIVGPFCLDRIGRRPIALGGCVVLFLIDTAAGGLACGGLRTRQQTDALASLCIVFSFVYAVGFQSMSVYLLRKIVLDDRLKCALGATSYPQRFLPHALERLP